MSYIYVKDSEKIKIKKRQRFPGSLMKGGIPGEQEKEERKKSLQDLYLHPKLSTGLVPYRLF